MVFLSLCFPYVTSRQLFFYKTHICNLCHSLISLLSSTKLLVNEVDKNLDYSHGEWEGVPSDTVLSEQYYGSNWGYSQWHKDQFKLQ